MARPTKTRVRTLEGAYQGSGRRFAVIVSRFNEYITRHLLDSCLNTLLRHGVSEEAITVIWVPGALEIPTAARRIANRRSADAIIALGCILRGDTPHFDHVARETTRGIAEIGRRTGIPTLFGVLTCDTLEQAIERAGVKMGNRGGEAAMAALEMADLAARI